MPMPETFTGAFLMVLAIGAPFLVAFIAIAALPKPFGMGLALAYLAIFSALAMIGMWIKPGLFLSALYLHVFLFAPLAGIVVGIGVYLRRKDGQSS